MFIVRSFSRLSRKLARATEPFSPIAAKSPATESPATDIPAATIPTHGAGSELRRDNGSVPQIRPQAIVLILRAPGENKGTYQIYSLDERTPAGGGGSIAFSLSVSQLQLPDDSPLLAEFLLEPEKLPPPHLDRKAISDDASLSRELHVIVSTRSGLRLAQGFYGDVLRPLLGALGLSECREGGGDGYRVTVTKDSNTIRDFARGLGASRSEKTVILLSGDGGVADLLNGLDQATDKTTATPPAPPTVVLLPLGTGNALFHSLHKPLYSTADDSAAPSPLVLGLRTLLRGTPAPLPTFRASFSPGAKLVAAPAEPGDGLDAIDSSSSSSSSSSSNTKDGGDDKDDDQHVHVSHLVGAIVASYGFHASLVWESDTPAYRRHGAQRFGMAAAELLKLEHAYDAAVEVRRGGGGGDFIRLHGGSRRSSRRAREEEGTGTDKPGGGGGGGGEGKVSYVLATLVSNLERTFAISPASRPLDGRLRLVRFGDVGGPRTMDIMRAAYRGGEHVAMPDVAYEEVEEVRVTVREREPRWRKACVDGTIVEVPEGGWMSVRREPGERVRVLVDGGDVGVRGTG